MVSYSPEGQILNVSGSLVLGFVSEVDLPLKQEFQITFVQVQSLISTLLIMDGWMDGWI